MFVEKIVIRGTPEPDGTIDSFSRMKSHQEPQQGLVNSGPAKNSRTHSASPYQDVLRIRRVFKPQAVKESRDIWQVEVNKAIDTAHGIREQLSTDPVGATDWFTSVFGDDPKVALITFLSLADRLSMLSLRQAVKKGIHLDLLTPEVKIAEQINGRQILGPERSGNDVYTGRAKATLNVPEPGRIRFTNPGVILPPGAVVFDPSISYDSFENWGQGLEKLPEIEFDTTGLKHSLAFRLETLPDSDSGKPEALRITESIDTQIHSDHCNQPIEIIMYDEQFRHTRNPGNFPDFYTAKHLLNLLTSLNELPVS